MPIKDELESLRNKAGMIHPRQVLDWAAKHKKSAIGKKLEWNNKAAGEKYRLQQIRYMIEIYAVDPLGGRQFVSLQIDRVAGGGYRPLQQVITTAQLRQNLLLGAFDDLGRLESLYRMLPELGPVWRLVASLRSSAMPRSGTGS